MITLIISTCLTAALTDCKEIERVPMPSSMTMIGCNQVAAVMVDPRVGQLVVRGQFKKATCEKS
jgi:hypothetical protein